jgi:CRISPR-associated endonuclease Csn1
MILGLDIGTNSVGWCLVSTRDGKPNGIIAAGVRCFAAGTKGDLERGREQPRGAQRRGARLMRRQTWRRQRRQRKLFALLQRHDLLPRTSAHDPTSIHACLQELDVTLRDADAQAATHRGQQVFLYRLRARAASEQVSRHELGRALYHLAQRRGFLSNRKKPLKDSGDDLGRVQTSIEGLVEAMRVSGSPTLGAYLATLDPDDERIRARWTARRMYVDEFNAIWDRQALNHSDLVPALRKQVFDAIFHQRPLKDQSHLIGRCELERGSADGPRGERRAPIAHPVFQRFRLLQGVNNLRIQAPDAATRPLTLEERTRLIDALSTTGDMNRTAIKRLLTLSPRVKLSIEEGGETRLPGDRTVSALRGIFGSTWDQLSAPERLQVLEDLMTFEKADALRRRGQRRWGLSGQAAEDFADLTLEDGYASLSVKAMERLIPHLEAGLSYSEALVKEYPDAFAANRVCDELPAVRSSEAFPELRNPTVVRSLTEVRQIVNEVVRRHGKPDVIRIELARDLKRGRKQRRDLWERMREQESLRKAAAAKITRETGDHHPSPRDVEKVMLANECAWQCPYTGRHFSMRDLLGDSPAVDAEHILPFSRSLDNGFFNKTLCFNEENRRKHNRTPFEAYAGSEQWAEILGRVKSFQGRGATEKLRRFTLEWVDLELSDEFTERHLNDTRYASKLAAEYVGRLYGGTIDQTGRRRVQVSTGALTAFLRWRWDLNKLLNDGDEKARDDHRHHAVDAIVIALTDAGAVKALSDAARRADELGRRRLFAEVQAPWDGFLDEARRVISGLVVSHRVSRRLNGALHEETLYGPPQPGDGHSGKQDVRHVRRPLAALSEGDLKAIVDSGIRERVRRQLDALKARDPKLASPAKAFADVRNHPIIETKSGRRIPIHHVRVRKTVTAVPIGTEATRRYVAPGSNHHMEVVAKLDSDGNCVRWDGHVVSRLEAMERWRSGVPIVRTAWGSDGTFQFSIASGDSLRLDLGIGQPALCVVNTVWGNRVEVTRCEDARSKSEIRHLGKEGGRLRFGVEALRRAKAQKVSVSPMGDVAVARD